jgi:hypothetical protein
MKERQRGEEEIRDRKMENRKKEVETEKRK